MSTLRLLALGVAVVLAACGSKPAPRVAPAPVPTAPAEPAAAAEPEKPAEPEWVYSSVGKRDPFRSFFSELATESKIVSRCASALGRFEVEQMKLVAIVTGLEDPVAMVEGPGGVGYTLRRGACIGKNGGVVSAIRSDGLVISEWAVRADGSRDSTQTVLRLPKQAALNLED